MSFSGILDLFAIYRGDRGNFQLKNMVIEDKSLYFSSGFVCFKTSLEDYLKKKQII